MRLQSTQRGRSIGKNFGHTARFGWDGGGERLSRLMQNWTFSLLVLFLLSSTGMEARLHTLYLPTDIAWDPSSFVIVIECASHLPFINSTAEQ
jgi:hypothetical protein